MCVGSTHVESVASDGLDHPDVISTVEILRLSFGDAIGHVCRRQRQRVPDAVCAAHIRRVQAEDGVHAAHEQSGFFGPAVLGAMEIKCPIEELVFGAGELLAKRGRDLLAPQPCGRQDQEEEEQDGHDVGGETNCPELFFAALSLCGCSSLASLALPVPDKLTFLRLPKKHFVMSRAATDTASKENNHYSRRRKAARTDTITTWTSVCQS